ncbi:peptidyl-prolyl cis-trans isomerase [Paenibacillus sp. HWE-109]|uniref:peptidylprolyl isomerase n=1 Tax=Paenibacillus sp. HWE-109 TaxID=1306526 RepID=UPI001EDCCE5B|nr:peptidyl-prolyl cis-trans isomerase [Paenibacillus sp. HWE-109]UKS24121.1 peptidyl-prolyl cis-trans isomerase [Paenibacillus sp. HWE-109]
MKKKIIALGLIVIVVMSLYFAAIVFSNQVEDDQTVATVNGEPIQIPEFMLILNNNYVAKTYNYFVNKYDVKDFKDFWSTAYGNEKPIDYARQLALKEWIRIKSEQILMKQYGVISDITYDTFLNELGKENNRRKTAVENKQVIYGPVEYSDYQYFSHEFTNDVIELKKILAKETFNLTENELKAAYEHSKEEYYRDAYAIQVEKISVKKSEHAEQLMKDLQSRLSHEDSFEKLKLTNPDIQIETQNFNETTAKTDYDLNPQLLTEAKKLTVGEISTIIDENNTLTIIKCIENKERGFQTYDKVKEQVKSRIIDEKYEVLVQQTIKEAKVKVVDKVYNQLSIKQ